MVFLAGFVCQSHRPASVQPVSEGRCGGRVRVVSEQAVVAVSMTTRPGLGVRLARSQRALYRFWLGRRWAYAVAWLAVTIALSACGDASDRQDSQAAGSTATLASGESSAETESGPSTTVSRAEAEAEPATTTSVETGSVYSTTTTTSPRADPEPATPASVETESEPGATRGSSADSGTLDPYQLPTVVEGSGRKLLALYVVGSDLEENWQAASVDLFELIDGYRSLSDPHDLEIVVAFGGADVDGWRGMKFANIAQLIEDSADMEFGNAVEADSYLYQADGAHMGDESSLELFLEYLGDGYEGFDVRFLVFWDHGGSYLGFGNDSNFGGDPLYLDEFERAFQNSRSESFDLIGFDACLMATVEVAKVIAPNADYMVASEALEPGHGWLWSDVVTSYVQADGIVEAGMGIVDGFVQDVHEYTAYPKTLSLLDLGQYDWLIDSLDAAILEAQRHLVPGAASDSSAAEHIVLSAVLADAYGVFEAEGFRTLIDLRDFAGWVDTGVDDAALDAKLGELISAIDRFVIYARDDGSRPYSSGIAISAPENIEYTAADSVSDAWRRFQGAFVRWIEDDTTTPRVASFESEVDPSVLAVDEEQADLFVGSDVALAVFEDENLIEVTTIYGFVYPYFGSDGELEDYFWPVAHLEAYPTENAGEYFTPPWDQWWFTIEYAPGEPTVPVPAVSDRRFEIDGETFTTYTVELLYHQAGKDYTGDEFPAEDAVMTIVVNEYMEVVDYYIQTYQYLYSGPDDTEGTVQFDKNTLRIAPGDEVQFWAWAYNLEDPQEDTWIDYSDLVVFAQEPVFGFEFLEFYDEFGEPLEYYYAMLAEDIAGNIVLTELVPASSVGEFSFEFELSGPSDVATFSFWGTAGWYIVFEVDSPADAFIRLSGPSGYLFDVDETTSGVEFGEAEVQEDGLYFLQIESSSLEPATFAVYSSVRLRHFDDPDDDLQLFLDESYIGYVDFVADWDWYALDLAKGDTVTVTASSLHVDTLLFILDSEGWDSDDDSGGGVHGTDSRLDYTAADTGRVFIGITDAPGTGTGEYGLSVHRAGS